MSAEYEFVFRKPTGAFITSACEGEYTNADYTLQLNTVGRSYISLPTNRYPVSLFGQDTIMEIWRKPRGGVNYLEGETGWLTTNIQATSTITELHAETANSLTKRRINAYQDGIDEGFVKFNNVPLDDMLKAIARNNFGANARTYNVGPNPDPNRDLSAYFTVQADSSQWPSASRRTTNNILYDIDNTNADKGSVEPNGPFLFWDVVMTNFAGVPPFFELRTYTGQRGTDRRGIVTFAEEENTMTAARLFYDWGSSFTRILTGGSGTGATRTFAVSDDPNLTALLAANPFALREKFVNGKKTTTAAEAQDYGDEYLKSKDARPYAQLSATLTESSCLRYGVDFFFGDWVNAYFLGQTFNTFVNPVHVHLENSREQIDIKITEKVNVATSDLARLMQEITKIRARQYEIDTIDFWG